MPEGQNILISLAPRHAKNIFEGRKLVELRRRTMHIPEGSTVWIYEKLPVGSVTGRVQAKAVHKSPPADLWRRFGSVSGLSKTEFFAYFDGVEQGCAIVLEDAQPLRTALSLGALRKIAGTFQPPQFFVRLTEQNPILGAARASSAKKTARKRLALP